MKWDVSLLLAVAVALFASETKATIRHVPADYPTIQAGIDAAAPGDTVLVAPGTYSQRNSRNIDGQVYTSIAFLKGNVTLLSEGGAAVTILDFQAQSGLMPTTIAALFLQQGNCIVDGFTLTGFRTNLVQALLLYCDDSVLISLRNCIIDSQNQAEGIRAEFTNLELANTVLRNTDYSAITVYSYDEYDPIFHTLSMTGCSVQDCKAGLSVTAEAQARTQIQISNSTFTDNSGNSSASAIDLFGGISGTIENCMFLRNVSHATLGSGAIRAIVQNPPANGLNILSSLFSDNESDSNGGVGSIYLSIGLGTALVQGNTVTGSKAVDSSGGALRLSASFGSFVLLRQNIIEGTTGGVALEANPNDVQDECNVLWNNPGGHASFPLDPTNRIASPQFCDPAAGNYFVGSASPCLPQNSDGCGLIGKYGEGCVTVPVSVSTSPIPLQILLDGVSFLSPVEDGWQLGSLHTLQAPVSQPLQPPDRYRFVQWEDGSTNPIRQVVGLDTPAEYVATYIYDPFATMLVESSPGLGITIFVDGVPRTTPYSTLADRNSSHILHAPSPQSFPNGHQYVFKSWEDGSTNPTRTVVIGDSVATYGYTAFFDVFSEVTITVLSSPPGERVLVDGVEYQSPASLIWEKATPHTLEAPGIIPKTEGSRLRFDHWSDNGQIVHVVTAPAAPATYTAFFTTQYKVDVEARPGGIVDTPSEWYDQGSTVALHAIPYPTFGFKEWLGAGAGSYTGPNNPATATVLGPISEGAIFEPAKLELTFSLSDTDPFQNSGSPLGFGQIYFWAACDNDQGVNRLEIDLEIVGYQIAAFQPAPGVLSQLTGGKLTLQALDCLPVPGILGTFFVTDTAGGHLCLATPIDPGVEPSPRYVDCNLGPPQYYFGPQGIRVRGCRTDGSPACDVGNGCSTGSPVPPVLLSLSATTTDSSAEIVWAVEENGAIAGFHVERSQSGGVFERRTISLISSSSPRFLDQDLSAATSYTYRLIAVAEQSETILGLLSVETASSSVVTGLLPSSPNPFTHETKVGFSLAASSWARLSIYDVAGRLVRTLDEGAFPAGERHVVWEGKNDRGERVTSGVYFLRLDTNGVQRISKIVRQSTK